MNSKIDKAKDYLGQLEISKDSGSNSSKDIVQGSKKFYLFPKLPVELQLMIWEAAACDQRLLVLNASIDSYPDVDIVLKAQSVNYFGIQNACRQSYHVAGKYRTSSTIVNGHELWLRKHDLIFLEGIDDILRSRYRLYLRPVSERPIVLPSHLINVVLDINYFFDPARLAAQTLFNSEEGYPHCMYDSKRFYCIAYLLARSHVESIYLLLNNDEHRQHLSLSRESGSRLKKVQSKELENDTRWQDQPEEMNSGLRSNAEIRSLRDGFLHFSRTALSTGIWYPQPLFRVHLLKWV